MITGEFPPLAGGVGDYSARLAAALEQLGLAVFVLTSDLGPTPGVLRPHVRADIRDWGVRSWRRVEQAITDCRADLVHIQYQPGAFQLRGAINLLPLWLRLRRPRVGVLVTFHDLMVPYLFPKAGSLRWLAVRALAAAADGSIFVDSADQARLGPAYNRLWIPVGSNVPCAPPPGFDSEAVRRALGADDGQLTVGYFGFLTRSKGAETLLHALRLLLDEGRDVRLALIGAAAGSSSQSDRHDQAACLALSRELGLEQEIAMTGYLDP